MNEISELKSKVLHLYKDTLEMKAKYVRRTGSPGNYKYEYADGSSKGGSGSKKDASNDKKESLSNFYDRHSSKYIDNAFSKNEAAVAYATMVSGSGEATTAKQIYKELKENNHEFPKTDKYDLKLIAESIHRLQNEDSKK